MQQAGLVQAFLKVTEILCLGRKVGRQVRQDGEMACPLRRGL